MASIQMASIQKKKEKKREQNLMGQMRGMQLQQIQQIRWQIYKLYPNLVVKLYSSSEVDVVDVETCLQKTRMWNNDIRDRELIHFVQVSDIKQVVSY